MNGVNWLLMRNIRIKHAKMKNAFYAMGSCNCVIYSDSSEVVWISIQRISNRSPRILNLWACAYLSLIHIWRITIDAKSLLGICSMNIEEEMELQVFNGDAEELKELIKKFLV